MATLEGLTAELDSIRATSTLQALQAEESLHELTNQCANLQQQVDVERTAREAAAEELRAETAKCQQMQGELLKEREGRTGDASLRAKLSEVEERADKEKRDLLEVLERANTDKEALQESLTSLRNLHKSLQTSSSSLEQAQQEAATTSRTSLLRIQTLTSTATSLEADKTFLTQELERSRTDAAHYRNEKHAVITQLQSDLEASRLEAESASTGSEKLKKVHQALVGRHEELLLSLSSTKEELALSTSQFNTEMGALRRLVDMLETRDAERKKRMEEVERGLEEERSGKQVRESQLIQEVEKERERFDALETRCHELRQALERGGNGFGAEDTPSSFDLSPSAQMAVRLQKTGRSYAEVYGEYVAMQEDLANERAESKRLRDCLNQILGDIEERAPLLKEQRLEYDRITTEATLLASQLAQALADQDDSSRQAESYRLDVVRLELDNSLVVSQLRDLGRQVRTLMRSIAATEFPGIETRSTADAAAFDEEEEQIKRRAQESQDTDSVVSAHLVTFKDINELQVQNQKLLRITREMGAQLEKGEQDGAERRRGAENAAVVEAHQLILRLKDEVESQRAKTEAFVRERDMFRRMLAQRGTAGEGSGATVGRIGSDGMDDAPQMLADVQANFDAYRAEIAIDTQRLRDDLTAAQRDSNAATTELAKTKAQTEFISERFRLLNESYELQSGEIAQMSKRTLQLQQTMAKQDTSSHKMTEELLELRSISAQLRHENTNFRTEQQVWKSVEARLIEENAALSRERGNLADLMRNLQTMQNELERSGTESRRRLDEQVVRLESQAVELKERLNQETDGARQLALRKELDGRTYQDRIDKLSSDYSTTREALVVARTSQDHLEQRVTDLVQQIASREEKLAVYEGRTAVDGAADPSLSREQQLEVEVVGLKNDLRALQVRLDQATANVAQYQSISVTQGESLSELHATYDQYKSSTDGALAAKETEIASLRERLHSLRTDLTAASTENSDLHRQNENERANFEKERKTLEDDMVFLRSAGKTAREAQLAAQADLRQQAKIAKEAHEKYERELVAHAEDVKRLTEIKEELEGVRASTAEHVSAAEVAKSVLAGSEASWSRQKTILEQEVVDLRKRCDDLNSQNSVLHEHLETFGKQAVQIQSTTTTAPAMDSTDAPSASSAESTEQLREVIRYLRREKEIVDLQLEFSKQEAARLRQQLEFANRNLEETRQALSEERSRSGDDAASTAQHAELLERIHTAKLLRESNSTLREENESNLRKAALLDTRLREALAELTPLKEQVQTLAAVVENKDHHLKLLEEDNDRWKNRNQQILAKYERIDPEELQALKDEVEKLRAVLSTVGAEKEAAAALLLEKTNLAESMRSNWMNGIERFKSLQQQARATRGDKDLLANELAEVKAKLEAGVGAASSTAEANSVSQAEKDQLVAQATALEEEKRRLEAQLRAELAVREETIKNLESQNGAVAAQRDVVAAQRDAALAESERLSKREKPIFDDNRRLSREAKERAEAMAKLQADFEGKNAEAIEAAVQARIEKAGPPTTLSDAAIEEAVQVRVAAAELALTASRDLAITTAVTQATAQLALDLAAVRAELALASTVVSTSTEGGNADFEAARQKLEQEFEGIKTSLTEQAKAREAEITERLTKEIKTLTDTAKVAASTTTTVSPPVNVDALVQTKLAALEKERAAAQKLAIDAAVAKALEGRQAEHKVELANAKTSAEKEAGMKNRLSGLQLVKLQKQLAEAKAVIAGGSTAAPAPVPTPVASTSTPALTHPLPPLVSTVNPSPTGTPSNRGGPTQRGGLPARGRQARGGGAAPRGGALAARVGAPLATPAIASIRGAASPTLALRGTAAGRGGGVLNRVLASNAAANATLAPPASPKRQRDDEQAAAGSPEAVKRVKSDEAPPTS